MKIGTDIVTKPAFICPTSPSLTGFLSILPLFTVWGSPWHSLYDFKTSNHSHHHFQSLHSLVILHKWCFTASGQHLPCPPILGGVHFYPMLVLILHPFNIQHGSEVIWYLSLSALFHLVWSPSGLFLLKWWDCLLQGWRASCCINIPSILCSLIFFQQTFWLDILNNGI